MKMFFTQSQTDNFELEEENHSKNPGIVKADERKQSTSKMVNK